MSTLFADSQSDQQSDQQKRPTKENKNKMDIQLFAGFHTMLGKHLNTDVGDIVSTIFHYYDGSYENYTLLELIQLMQDYRMTFGKEMPDFPWNKKAIIKLIETLQLPIPIKCEPMEYTIWEYCFRHIYTDYIRVEKSKLDFMENDIIMLPNKRLYEIEIVYDDIPKIYLYDMEIIDEEMMMLATDFFKMIDEEDITLMQSTQAFSFMNKPKDILKFMCGL